MEMAAANTPPPQFLGFFSNDQGAPFFFGRASTATAGAAAAMNLSPPPSALAAAVKGRRVDVFDCKHGRVLLGITGGSSGDLLVELVLWDPLTGHEDSVQAPISAQNYGTPALICRAGRLGVVLAYSNMPRRAPPTAPASASASATDTRGYLTMASLYSFESRTWGALAIMAGGCSFDIKPSTAVRNAAVYWMTGGNSALLEYKLGEGETDMSTLQPIRTPLPVELRNREFAVVPAMGSDAKLGLVCVLGVSLLMLYYREEEGGNYGLLRRDKYTVVDEEEEGNNPMMPRAVIGFAEEANAIFVQTGRSVFMLDLETKQHRRVFGRAGFSYIYPFHTAAGKAVLDDAQQDQGNTDTQSAGKAVLDDAQQAQDNTTQSGGVTISVDGDGVSEK